MLHWELAPHSITSEIFIDSSSQRAHPHPRGWRTKPHLLMQQGHIAERHMGWKTLPPPLENTICHFRWGGHFSNAGKRWWWLRFGHKKGADWEYMSRICGNYKALTNASEYLCNFIKLHGWVLPTTNKISHKYICSIYRAHTSLSCSTMLCLKNELFRAGIQWGPALRAIQGDERMDLLIVRSRSYNQRCFRE